MKGGAISGALCATNDAAEYSWAVASALEYMHERSPQASIKHQALFIDPHVVRLLAKRSRIEMDKSSLTSATTGDDNST